MNSNKTSGTNNNDNQTKQIKQIQPRTNLEYTCTENPHNQFKDSDKKRRGTNKPILFIQLGSN